ncbi:MAG TPA: GHMP kinase [Actinomycetota bacterium]|nr:GHMP kinase [Actinomycetota bacterium]
MNDLTVDARAPLRISFVGGGTDFPHWFERHGGAVLSATIDHYAHVRVEPRDDEQIRIRDLRLEQLVQYHVEDAPIYDGVMDLPKAAIHRIGLGLGMDVDLRNDAPPGSGLGGSSALVTAAVAALAALGGRRLTREELARTSYAIEREDLGIAGGWQDQYAAAFGGFNLIEFSSTGVAVTPVEVSDETLTRLRSNLMLCYSGRARTNLGLIDAQVRLYHEGREETIQGMKELQSLVYEMRDAIESGRIDDLGAMFRQAYESKRRMNPHIAEGTPIERLLEAAGEAGATGGKICGAGGGGYLLLYCPAERQPAVRDALERLGGQFAPFAFDSKGARATVGDAEWRPDP